MKLTVEVPDAEGLDRFEPTARFGIPKEGDHFLSASLPGKIWRAVGTFRVTEQRLILTPKVTTRPFRDGREAAPILLGTDTRLALRIQAGRDELYAMRGEVVPFRVTLVGLFVAECYPPISIADIAADVGRLPGLFSFRTLHEYFVFFDSMKPVGVED